MIYCEHRGHKISWSPPGKEVTLEIQVSTSNGNHPNASPASSAVSFFEIHIPFSKKTQHLDEGNK